MASEEQEPADSAAAAGAAGCAGAAAAAATATAREVVGEQEAAEEELARGTPQQQGPRGYRRRRAQPLR